MGGKGKFCVSCGAQHDESDKYCPACGAQTVLPEATTEKTVKSSKGLAIWLAVIGLVLIGAILLFGAPSDVPEISKSTQQNATPIESQTGAVPVQKRAGKATQMKFKRIKSHDFGIPIRSPSGGSNKVGFSIDVPAHWKPDSILEEQGYSVLFMGTPDTPEEMQLVGITLIPRKPGSTLDQHTQTYRDTSIAGMVPIKQGKAQVAQYEALYFQVSVDMPDTGEIQVEDVYFVTRDDYYYVFSFFSPQADVEKTRGMFAHMLKSITFPE